MYYHYRWFYTSILCGSLFLVGCLYDLKPHWQQLLKLNASKQSLIKKISYFSEMTSIQQNKTINPSLMNQTSSQQQVEFLGRLSLLSHANGLVLQSMTILPMRSTYFDAKYIRIILQGEFERAIGFIEGLLKEPNVLAIHDFSLRGGKQTEMHFFFDLLMGPSLKERAIFSEENLRNKKIYSPFCVNEGFAKSSLPIRVKSSIFPLSQFKMVGFLQQGGHPRGLLQLQNGKIIAVEKGSLMGEEQAEVVDIQQEEIAVILPSKKRWIFKR